MAQEQVFQSVVKRRPTRPRFLFLYFSPRVVPVEYDEYEGSAPGSPATTVL
jgi:hypothetical protein